MAPSFLMYMAAIALNVSTSAMELILGILLILLLRYLYKNSVDITKDCPYFIPFFVYWVATVVSVFLGSDSVRVGKEIFGAWNIMYVFAGYYFISGSNVRLTLVFLILGSVALAGSAFYDVAIRGLPRGSGFFSIYMSTGNVLAMGAIAALAVLVSGYEKGKAAFFYAVCLCAILAGIYYTGTRGALLAFLAAACLMFVMKFRLKGAAVAFALVLAAVAGAYFSGIGDRFAELMNGFSNPETSHGWRIMLWKAAWNLIKEYPIFGIGPGAFKPMIIGSMPSNPLPLGHPHNAYLNQLVLYGIVGFAAFCWFYGRMAWDLAAKSSANRYAFIGFFVFLVFLLEGITENNFTDGEVKMFHAFLTGCMLGAVRKNLPDSAAPNRPRLVKNI